MLANYIYIYRCCIFQFWDSFKANHPLHKVEKRPFIDAKYIWWLSGDRKCQEKPCSYKFSEKFINLLEITIYAANLFQSAIHNIVNNKDFGDNKICRGLNILHLCQKFIMLSVTKVFSNKNFCQRKCLLQESSNEHYGFRLPANSHCIASNCFLFCFWKETIDFLHVILSSKHDRIVE